MTKPEKKNSNYYSWFLGIAEEIVIRRCSQEFKAFDLEHLKALSSIQNQSRKSTSLHQVARLASRVHSLLTIFCYFVYSSK